MPPPKKKTKQLTHYDNVVKC